MGWVENKKNWEGDEEERIWTLDLLFAEHTSGCYKMEGAGGEIPRISSATTYDIWKSQAIPEEWKSQAIPEEEFTFFCCRELSWVVSRCGVGKAHVEKAMGSGIAMNFCAYHLDSFLFITHRNCYAHSRGSTRKQPPYPKKWGHGLRTAYSPQTLLWAGYTGSMLQKSQIGLNRLSYRFAIDRKSGIYRNVKSE